MELTQSINWITESFSSPISKHSVAWTSIEWFNFILKYPATSKILTIRSKAGIFRYLHVNFIKYNTIHWNICNIKNNWSNMCFGDFIALNSRKRTLIYCFRLFYIQYYTIKKETNLSFLWNFKTPTHKGT